MVLWQKESFSFSHTLSVCFVNKPLATKGPLELIECKATPPHTSEASTKAPTMGPNPKNPLNTGKATRATKTKAPNTLKRPPKPKEHSRLLRPFVCVDVMEIETRNRIDSPVESGQGRARRAMAPYGFPLKQHPPHRETRAIARFGVYLQKCSYPAVNCTYLEGESSEPCSSLRSGSFILGGSYHENNGGGNATSSVITSPPPLLMLTPGCFIGGCPILEEIRFTFHGEPLSTYGCLSK